MLKAILVGIVSRYKGSIF